MRNFKMLGVALALATGAFWFTMLRDPPKSEAADPSYAKFSPMDIKTPAGLSAGSWDAH